MWRNYLTVGLRTLARGRAYTAINIVGLSVGLASCILILIFVQQQRSYEQWIPSAPRIAQLQTVMNDPDEGRIVSAQASRPAAAALADEFPQLEASVALTSSRILLRQQDDWRFADLLFVDPTFFKVFDLPLLRGDPATALSASGNAVLTEAEAGRIFGSTDVLGREFTIDSRGVQTNLKVSGVLRDLPPNTHLKFTMLTAFDHAVLGTNEFEFRSWSRLSGYVYARLRSPDALSDVNSALPALLQRRLTEQDRRTPPAPVELVLVPVSDIHLGGAREDSMKPAGDRLAVAAFGGIALLILIIACMNFASLATAQSARRAREVALRKVLGARRGQVAGQFVGEALILTLVAVLIALALVELAIPAFAALMGAELQVNYFGPDGLFVPVLLLWIVTALACGLYPAMVLSRFLPAKILRSGRAEMAEGGSVRNLLVIGQFAISIALIVCTAVVYAQTSHARSADPGFRQSGLLVIDNLMRLHQSSDQRSLMESLKRLKGVTAAGLGTAAPGDDRQAALPVTLAGRTDPTLLNLHYVDWGYADALGIPLLAGRLFDESRPQDDSTVDFNPTNEDGQALIGRGANVVLSQDAARKIGARTPADALDRRILVPVRGVLAPVPATVIGVVGDAQLRSVRDRIRPAVYMVNRQRYTHALLRFDDSDPGAIREAASASWARFLPHVPFEGHFAQEIMERFYQADKARAGVFAAFAGLAILISCLGLFGLAALTAERRTREIGIRKIFGARTRDIVRLLVWQFSRLVLIANLIAWPIAWWLMRDWLNGFYDRIALHPGFFIAAGLLALITAAATIASHAIRVGRSNPIHALRQE